MYIITPTLFKENDFFIFFQWGFDEGGDISSPLSLAHLPATYSGGGHRTPRYSKIQQKNHCDIKIVICRASNYLEVIVNTSLSTLSLSSMLIPR